MKIIDRLEQHKNYIISQYNNGLSVSKLGKEFNCNSGTIWYFLKNNNVETRKIKKNKDGYLNNKLGEIQELYNNGLSINKIAKAIGGDAVTIARFMKKHNMDTTRFNTNKSKRFAASYTKEILDLYNQNISIMQIADKLGFSQSVINKILRKNNIEIRGHAKYTGKYDFFERIDTEEKAYILGFFYADGNILTNKSNGQSDYKARLQLAELPILEQIKEILEYTGPIYHLPPPKKFPHRKEQWCLCLNNRQIVEDLIKLGCGPKKSLTLQFPTENQVPKHLLNHFIRGYIDGDGSIIKKVTNSQYVGLVSTESFLNKLNEFCYSEFGFVGKLYTRYPERKNPTRQWMIGRRQQVLTFLDWLYTDAVIYLDRKYQTYLSLKNH